MKQLDDAKSFSQMLHWVMNAKRVSYRRHGNHGELKRPMMHRFEVKGGETLVQALSRNLEYRNTLLQRLMQRGVNG